MRQVGKEKDSARTRLTERPEKNNIIVPILYKTILFFAFPLFIHTHTMISLLLA